MVSVIFVFLLLGLFLSQKMIRWETHNRLWERHKNCLQLSREKENGQIPKHGVAVVTEKALALSFPSASEGSQSSLQLGREKTFENLF